MIDKAKKYAFLLLKFRPRTEVELFRRLEEKGFAKKAIKEVVVFLKYKGFVDDRSFAKFWIESRLRKPLSLEKIRQELILKGINRKIIDTQLNQIDSGYSESDIVDKIVKERLKLNKLVALDVARRRIYGYLLRRGFSREVIENELAES